MLNIGQFSDTFLPVVDGVGRVAVAYAETLSKMGHLVTVGCPMYDTGYRGGLPFEIVDYKAMPLPGMKQYRQGEAPMDPHYRKRMKMIPLDIVHAHSPFTAGSEALRLAVQRKIPLVGTFHSKYYDDFLKATKSETLAKWGTKIVVNYFERCDEVWAVGSSAADVLKGYGYTGDVKVMPNGATIRSLDEAAAAEVSRRWQLGDDPMFLFVGQMNWKKNIATVLDACAMLAREGKRFRLILAGQGQDEKEIQEKIEANGLRHLTVMTGHITDTRLLDALYAKSCLFTFPSLYDTSALVVREAAVMGTASVVVKGSCAADVIRHEKNGYLCENTPESLKAVLVDAMENEQKRLHISTCAQETIPIPWDKLMVDVVERYERLISMNREGKLKKKSIRIV